MKTSSLIILGGIFLLFTCCRSTNQGSRKAMKNVSTFVIKESKEIVQDTVLFKSVTAIPLEVGTQKYAGIKIDRIYFDEEKFFILDKGSEVVSIYNEKGHHVKTIKKSGWGLEEFRDLADICVDRLNKELIVLASEPSKILFYSYQGEFLRENLLPTYYESIATDGNFIYLQDNNVVKGEKEITVYSRNLRDKKEALEVRHQFKGHEIGEYSLFAFGKTMTQDKDIHLAQYFDNSIYTAKNGNISLKYTFDFKESSLPDTLLEIKMRPSTFLKLCKKNDYISFITEVIENEEYLVFNTNVGLCVCDKQTEFITKYNEIVDSTTGYVVNQMQAVGNTNNKMAVLWPLTFIKDSKILPVKETSIYKQIKREPSKQLPQIDDRHNAVLVIYEF